MRPPPPMSPPSYTATMKPDQRGFLEDDGIHASSKDKPPLRAWLGLRSRLFLSLFTPALASLLFIFVGLLTSIEQAGTQAENVKSSMMAACRSTERAANTLASVPLYFSKNVNEATAKAIEETVHGLGRVLSLALTAAESLLIFLTEMYRSLFLCFIELLVRGSLALLTSAVDALSGVVQDIGKSVRASVQGSVDAINATLRASLGGINDILKIVGKSISVPQLPMPDLSALNNIALPSQIDGGLRQLNESLPTLDDVRRKMDALISGPFDLMKQQVNETILQYSFDRSVLPLPSTESISLCQNSTAFTRPIDELDAAMRKGAHIGLVVLLLLVILLLAASATMEWFTWRSLQRQVDRTDTAFRLAHDDDDDDDDHADKKATASESDRRTKLMSLLQLSAHPFLATSALTLAPRLGIRSTKAITRMRWWLAWCVHPAPLAMLCMGVVGLFAAIVQIAIVKHAARRAQSQTIGMWKGSVEGGQEAVNEHLRGVSLQYANASNTAIINAQDALNNGVLQIVNKTTSTINGTLNELMNGIATAVNSTFANTPLFTPVQSFVGCILGAKVANIEKALTWIQNNSHVSFPLVADDVFLIPENWTQAALVTPAQDEMQGDQSLPTQLANTYLNALRRQRTLFLALILTYLALVLIGSLVVLLSSTPKGLRAASWFSLFHRKRVEEGKEEPHRDELLSLPANLTPTTSRTGHRSISQPLLPEVASFHLQQDQREFERIHGLQAQTSLDVDDEQERTCDPFAHSQRQSFYATTSKTYFAFPPASTSSTNEVNLHRSHKA